MYEVFLNDRKIVITGQKNVPFIKDPVKFENLNSVAEVKNWFQDFAMVETNSTILISSTPEIFWKELFMPAFISIPAAGGIVIRNNKLLFINRNGKWDLPKGKIDPGESEQEAAIREVTEECGITGHQITKKLPSTYHIYQSPWIDLPDHWILKETHWFEMKYSGSNNGIPEIHENITEIKWFAKNDLDEVFATTYESLKPVISIYKLSR